MGGRLNPSSTFCKFLFVYVEVGFKIQISELLNSSHLKCKEIIFSMCSQAKCFLN